jgi:hypothetical protein
LANPERAGGTKTHVTVKFFNKDGSAESYPTSKGTKSEIDLDLTAFATDFIEMGPGGNLQTGWAQIDSTFPIGVYLTWLVFNNGQVIAQTAVLPSPAQLAFSTAYNENNGIALANVSNTVANIIVQPFNSDGSAATSLNRLITLQPGAQFACYFNQSPFSFPADAQGVVVFSSNVQIIAVEVGYTGQVFSTVPVLPAPRRLDIPSVN